MDLKERLAKVVTVADAEKQLELAVKYVKRIRSEAKKAKTLQQKIALEQKQKQAELVVRQMRRSVFDIEDAINAGKPASSVLS